MTALSNLIEWRIPTRIALYVLFAFCFLFIYSIGFVDAGYPTDIVNRITSKVTALQALQIYFLIEIIKRIDAQHALSAIELVLVTAISIVLFVFIFRRPEYALAFITIAATLRFIKVPVINVAALALAAFSFQYAAAFGPLFLFHKLFAYVDAAVVRFLLLVIGLPVEGTGTYIQFPPTGANLHVNVGCTSSLAMIYGISGAFIYGIYQKAKIQKPVVIAFFTLLLVITLINWLRMGLMIESRDAYKFWHEGTGMQIVSLVNAVAILGIMHLGIVRSRTVHSVPFKG